MAVRRMLFPLLICLAAVSPRAAAQEVDSLIALGMPLEAHDPPRALAAFRAALQLDSGSYQANWRAAQALVDIGKQTPDSVKSPERDSLYAEAERLARRAVEASPDSADGHYILAAAIGRASLTKSKKERVRRAAEIRNEALRAIQLNPQQDRAYHVLGRWNAEVMRLSGFQRFLAKSFLGGAVFRQASWDHAIEYLTQAVSLAPASIYHRLDLAEVYVDRDRYRDARQLLLEVAELPVYDAMDHAYKDQAAALFKKIEGKQDQS